jgi:hypothetical protein
VRQAFTSKRSLSNVVRTKGESIFSRVSLSIGRIKGFLSINFHHFGKRILELVANMLHWSLGGPRIWIVPPTAPRSLALPKAVEHLGKLIKGRLSFRTKERVGGQVCSGIGKVLF